MTSLATSERAALCDLFDTVGPDAPTLCDGWTTRDLACHLIIRERRPDAAAGLVLPPLAGRAGRITRQYAERPWSQLVDLVRSGPPRVLPGALDRVMNSVEFFVHHEDVRRAEQGWEPRPLSDHQQEQLWRRLRTMSRLLLRSSPVGVALRRPDGVVWRAHPGGRYVTVAGPPAELVMYVYGRDQARVEVLGDPADVERFRAAERGF